MNLKTYPIIDVLSLREDYQKLITYMEKLSDKIDDERQRRYDLDILL